MPEQSSQLLYMPPGRNDEAPTFQLPLKPRIFHSEEDVPQQCVCNLDQSTVSQVLFHLELRNEFDSNYLMVMLYHRKDQLKVRII